MATTKTFSYRYNFTNKPATFNLPTPLNSLRMSNYFSVISNYTVSWNINVSIHNSGSNVSSSVWLLFGSSQPQPISSGTYKASFSNLAGNSTTTLNITGTMGSKPSITDFYNLNYTIGFGKASSYITINSASGYIIWSFTINNFPAKGEIISSSELDAYNRLVTISDHDFNHTGVITTAHGLAPYNNTNTTNGAGTFYLTSGSSSGGLGSDSVSDPITVTPLNNLINIIPAPRVFT